MRDHNHIRTLPHVTREPCRDTSAGPVVVGGELSGPTISNFELSLATAHSRLLRAVLAWGVPVDVAEDLVQETCLSAWRHREQLQSVARFDAWLLSIAHNCCRMYFRRSGNAQREAALVARTTLFQGDDLATDDPLIGDALSQATDPAGQDPFDALERHDLSVLLDRALSHLSAEERRAVELCYLAELPQRQAARQLGVTLSALESRLHRARKQLRRVLASELRGEAATFGLALDEPFDSGWRETREWCHFCGHQRLRGQIEPQSDGSAWLRLRCPTCKQRYGANWVESGPTPALAGYRSFGCAIKQCYRASGAFYTRVRAGEARCPICHEGMRLRLLRSDDVPWQAFPGLTYAILECPCCHSTVSSAATVAALTDDQTVRFLREHPRWVIEPDILSVFAGRPALRHCIRDAASTARMVFFTDPATLSVLGAALE